jgi:O-antigen ligase
MLTAADRLHRGPARIVYSQPVPRSDYAEVPKIVRWSFIGFFGVLPFEAVSLSFTSFSVAKLSGVPLIVAYFFFYNPISGKRPFPPGSAPLACFLTYFLVFAANGIFLDGFHLSQFFSVFLTLTQLLLIFWISSSLLRVELLSRRALLAFAFASVALALGTLLQVPGFSTSIESRIGERITALDFNPNYLAYTMALAAIILIGTALEIQVRYSWSKALLIALVLPLLALTVRTGSRTGIAAFLIGFAMCLLPNRQSGRRLIIIVLCVFVGVSLLGLASQHQTVLARFEQSTSGDFAGRQVIIPTSLRMIAERPLFGWQPVAYWEELGRRVGKIWGAKDAHNLVFHLLMEVGLFGAVPFLIGVALCALGAWKARSGKFGNLPFALLMMTLSANLTHTYLGRKPQWLILALAVAAAAAMPKTKAARLPVRQPLRAAGRALGERVLVGQVRRREF